MDGPIVLLTVPEAAARLRRTEKQLRWMMHTGQAPVHAKIAGRVYFNAAEIDAFIARAFATAEAAREGTAA